MKAKHIFIGVCIVAAVACVVKYQAIFQINPCKVYYEVSHNPPFFELCFVRNGSR